MKQTGSSQDPKDERPGVALELSVSADQTEGRIDTATAPGINSDRPWWSGELGILSGVVALIATAFAAHPFHGGFSLGVWRVAGIAIGLLAIGAGLAAVLRDTYLRTVVKAAVLVVSLAVAGTFAFRADHIPAAPQNCSIVDGPTLEDRGPVYCVEADGTVVRMSINTVKECPGGVLVYPVDRVRLHGWGGWSQEMHGIGCPL